MPSDWYAHWHCPHGSGVHQRGPHPQRELVHDISPPGGLCLRVSSSCRRRWRRRREEPHAHDPLHRCYRRGGGRYVVGRRRRRMELRHTPDSASWSRGRSRGGRPCPHGRHAPRERALPRQHAEALRGQGQRNRPEDMVHRRRTEQDGSLRPCPHGAWPCAVRAEVCRPELQRAIGE